MALLEMQDLKTFFTTKRGVVKAVNGVSYKVEAGKTLGVVGESGSGKSVSAMSMLQLLDGNGYIAGGSIMFDGKDLTKLSLSRDAENPRQRDFRHLPGADDQPEPGVHHRAPGFRAVHHPSGDEQGRSAARRLWKCWPT